MTETEIMKEVEADARDVRLSEQAIFRNVIENKQRKFRRILLFIVGSFVLVASGWVVFHCLRLVSGS